MQSGASLSELRKRLSTITCSERRFELIENALRPPEPQLLDTCVVQNLDWVDRQIELQGGRVIWDDASLEELAQKYGNALAEDLIALGTLYKEFECRSGYYVGTQVAH